MIEMVSIQQITKKLEQLPPDKLIIISELKEKVLLVLKKTSRRTSHLLLFS
jgi:hypothetical protein